MVPHLLALRFPPPSAGPADALLVLSGGENRISEGFRAWRAGKATDLLIIGAWREATLTRILPDAAGLSPEERSRIVLEEHSENTMENATSARSLALARGYRSAILVTSDYHMPRAYLAVRAALPAHTKLSALPVRTEWKGKNARWRMVRLFFVEGWKYWGYRLLLLLR